MESKTAKAKEIYNALKQKFPKADALYEDIIKREVGNSGLMLLREMHMIETCAVFNNRKLYAL